MLLEPLREGDIVDVIAPASKCSVADLRNGVRALMEVGLVPRVPKNLFGPSFLFSNSDSVRLEHLRAALYARDSKMIWCVRGGYGSLRLLPSMSSWKKPARPKIVMGYSDITTLHTFLNQKWKWPTVHGPMVERFGRGVMSAAEKRAVLDLLFGRAEVLEFTGVAPLNAAARRRGVVRGPIVGGNMAVLQSSLGTAFGVRARGRILFLEDTGERPHRMDRMFTQFAQAGVFDGVAAVVFGHFLLADAKDRRELWRDVIPRFASSVRFPVLAGLPVGHDPKRQFPLPFLTDAELVLGAKARLTVDSGIALAE